MSCRGVRCARARGAVLPVLLTALPLLAAAAGVQREENPRTGLLSWRVEQGGVSLELIQLLPDFVRAVYGSRGFPPEAAQSIASYCVFGTILHNDSEGQVSYRVADWRYFTPEGQARAPKTKSEWIAQWKEQGVPFRWTILPDEQTFDPGDWSQGFTTVALPPGTVFRFEYSWRSNGEMHHGRIEDLQCAPAQPEPAG